jgi:hypothetical protein
MSLLVNLPGSKSKDPAVVKMTAKQQSEKLMAIINESIQIGLTSPDLETKKARLEYAMKKVIELISLINKYPVVESKKLSAIYNAIREVRTEIKALESKVIPLNKRDVA